MHIVEKEFKSFIKQTNYSKYVIAYSGGVDSQVLLYLASKYIRNSVCALHVNHGISDNASSWESFCRKEASLNDVEIKVAHFQLKEEKSNLEEKARELRHDFFEKNVLKNEALLTGHHLDDQAETFMLRLMRGSGVDGLSSMQPSRSMKESGTLIRPLLNVSKEDIVDYAKKEGLEWVEDESNASSDYDRNFIRNEVMPLLKTRWENANKSISNTVKNCQEVKRELDSSDDVDFESTVIDNRLSIVEFNKLKETKKRRVVRSWLKSNNKKMLDRKALNVLIEEVINSRPDSKACYRGKDYSVRKSFGYVYLIEDNDSTTFIHPENTSIGDDSLKMMYRGKLRSKKTILKEKKIPYWEREHYVFYVDQENKVVALGNIKSD